MSATIELRPAPSRGDRLRSSARGLVSWARLLSYLTAMLYLAATIFLAGWVAVPSLVAGVTPVLIEGGSMEPALSIGDVALVRPEDGTADGIRPGNIVTFEDTGGRVVTHRVIAVDPDGSLVTKGDANAERDGPTVPLDRVLGVGWLAVPVAGLPIHWLRSSSPWLLVWLGVTTAALTVALGVRPPPRPARPAVQDEDDDGQWRWPTTDGGS